MPAQLVMIVDAEATSQGALRVALEEDGYDVLVAATAAEASELLSGFLPKLVLVDVGVPRAAGEPSDDAAGLELARALKGEAKTRDVVVIALARRGTKADESAARTAGCDAFLAKPIDARAVPRVVADAIARRSARAKREAETILLVEANPATRRTVRAIIESAGRSVLEAGDGATALRRAPSAPPSIVVIDAILPDMRGEDLALELRGLLPEPAPPMICLAAPAAIGARDENADRDEIGSVFAATLAKPVEPSALIDALDRLLAPSLAEPSATAGRRVLVVDDDALQRKLLVAYFVSEGFEVSAAADGAEALAMAGRARPDVIVSDILMPELNGFELCLAVRRHPELAKLPFVLVSAHFFEPAEQELAARVGASALVPRTGGPSALRGAVLEALRAAPRAPSAEPLDDVLANHTRAALEKLDQLAAENARLTLRSSTLAAQLAVLAGATDALAKKRRVDGSFGELLTTCLEMAGIETGALFLQRGRALALEHAIGGRPGEASRVATLFDDEPSLAEALRGCRLIAIPSPDIPAEVAERVLPRIGVAAALLVPVLVASKLEGAILLGAASEEIARQEPAAFARVLGAQVEQAIEMSRAFERLRESEERVRAMTDSMRDVVVTLQASDSPEDRPATEPARERASVLRLFGDALDAIASDARLGRAILGLASKLARKGGAAHEHRDVSVRMKKRDSWVLVEMETARDPATAGDLDLRAEKRLVESLGGDLAADDRAGVLTLRIALPLRYEARRPAG